MCDSKKTKKTPFEELRTPRSRAAKLKMNPGEAQAARRGNMVWGKFERRGGKYKVGVIAVLLAIGCSLVYHFHVVLKSETVFSHFFYIPVILACVWWKRKGLTVAVFLSACLILSHIFLKPGVGTGDDYFRAMMFIAVALIVTVLSEYAAKAEEKLERYRFMVESAHDAIFFKDLKSRYIIANDKALEAFGLPREQVIGKNDNEIMPNEDQARKNIEDDQLVFKTGRLTEITKQMTNADGKERWFQAIKAPQFDDKGNTVGLVGIARDVTEHKKAEELLGAERQRLYSLLDGLPVFVYLQAPDHSVRFANRYFREHFGNPEGKSCYEVLWGAKEPCKPCPTFRVFDTKKPQIWEWSQSPDGRIYEINDYPFSDVDGSPVVLELGIDITERKKAEKRLAKVNECFLSFGADPIENIQLLTAMCGEQLEACCALYNRLEDGMLCSTGHWNVPSDYKLADKAEGHICFDVIRKSKDDIFIVRNLPETIYFHTDPNVAAYGLKTYIGKAVKCHGKYIGSACVVYKDDVELSRDDKRMLEIVASAIGVEEERKQAEDALQRVRDELEVRVEQRTAELARTNEELRNEISERKKAEQKLLGYQNQLRSLASELSLAEERLRRRIATDVHDHIGQNLAISKIKLDSLAEAMSSSELSKDLEEIRDLVAQTIESTRSLTFELSPPVLYELGFEPAMEWLVRETRQRHGLSTEFTDDRQSKPLDNNIRVLLFQAVRELLVNVVKHAQARNVTVSTRRLGDEICVSVEDDGVGFNVSESGSHEYRAEGFGLFSIRERLGHIGGYLDIASGAGKGTRVTLTAPINQEKEKNKGKQK